MSYRLLNTRKSNFATEPRILTQLNRGESRHSVARAVFLGQRG
jgi:TnpA family transposase